MPVWQKTVDEKPRLAATKRIALDSRIDYLVSGALSMIEAYAQKKNLVGRSQSY